MSLTTKVLLNKTRQKNDSTYPLIIRLTYNRKSINIPVGINLPEKDWDSHSQRIKSTSKFANNITRQNKKIQSKLAHIHDVITKLEEESSILTIGLKEVKKIIMTRHTNGTVDVFSFIDNIITELKESKKQGNARVYNSLKVKLKSLIPSSNLSFDEIDYNFLKKLEVKHYSNGGNAGGLSVYLRTLRAVYNRAIKSGYAISSKYPFKEFKIKNGTPKRLALTEKEFTALKSYKLDSNSPLYKARMLFMASFYMRGMNWMDMSLLKKSNLSGDGERINYIRSKTGKHFSIKINQWLKEILNFYNLNQKDKNDFLFPILSLNDSPVRYHDIITNKRERLNKRLNQLAELCNISKITIYSARHTYATMGKRKGVPTAVIQESLGHKTESITQTYLDSFGNNIIDDFDDIIMNE